jgi:hypothetical protein
MNRKSPRGPMPEPTPNRAEKPAPGPAADQEVAGYDAEGRPFYRRKQSAIEGPRAGQSSKGRPGKVLPKGGRF